MELIDDHAGMRADFHDSAAKNAPPHPSGGDVFRGKRAPAVLRRPARGRGERAAGEVQAGGARPSSHETRAPFDRYVDALLEDVVV